MVLLRARQFLGRALPDDVTISNPGFLFEEIVKHAVGAYIVSNHAIRFGTAGPAGTRGDGLPMDAPGAIAELARRMHEEPGAIPQNARGDYRADVVAWRPFGDGRPGQLVALCQATISKGDWQTKQIPPKWFNQTLLQLVALPVPLVAFIETMSAYSMTFFRGSSFNSIPLDRLRILSLVSDDGVTPELIRGIREWSTWAITKLPV